MRRRSSSHRVRRFLVPIIVQAVFLAVVLATGAALLTNAYGNLRDRGIATGFAFLTQDESNFVISETGPVPMPGPDAARGLAVLAAVLLAIVGLRRWRRTRAIARRHGATVFILVVMLLVVLPLLGILTDGPRRGLLSVATYDPPSTYLLAMLTGLFNTLRLSLFSIILGTVVGLAVGIGRLSGSWLVRSLSGWFIEITRNVPLLLQLFFWYFGVLLALPSVHESIIVGDVLILNNRGVNLPGPILLDGFRWFAIATTAAIVSAIAYARYTWRRRERGGARLSGMVPGMVPRIVPMLVLLVGVPCAAWIITGGPVGLDHPELRRFNYWGGINLTPEFAAMLIGLTLYSGGFIAEIVRSGIQAIPRGQTEAALALGLTRPATLRLVILPQARRIMVPPLTSTYLGTIKDSSLGVAVGYPELVTVSGTILDASGQALETLAILILFYMSVTLLTSAAMSAYAARTGVRAPS